MASSSWHGHCRLEAVQAQTPPSSGPHQVREGRWADEEPFLVPRRRWLALPQPRWLAAAPQRGCCLKGRTPAAARGAFLAQNFLWRPWAQSQGALLAKRGLAVTASESGEGTAQRVQQLCFPSHAARLTSARGAAIPVTVRPERRWRIATRSPWPVRFRCDPPLPACGALGAGATTDCAAPWAGAAGSSGSWLSVSCSSKPSQRGAVPS
jgi:hypothetical protein